MLERANLTPNWRPTLQAEDERVMDGGALRARWRLLMRPARAQPLLPDLSMATATFPATNGMLMSRWRPMSAPAKPVPPWRWPTRARAERARSRADARRWRPLTAR